MLARWLAALGAGCLGFSAENPLPNQIFVRSTSRTGLAALLASCCAPSRQMPAQMTPALFRPLFRASRSRGLHWRTGCRDPLRGPSDLKHQGRRTAWRSVEPYGLFIPWCVESYGEVTPVSSREGRLAKHGLRSRFERRAVLAPCPAESHAPDCAEELRTARIVYALEL